MEQLAHWIQAAVEAWVGGIEQSGYFGIFMLMAIESSFIPFPSEIVMIPAGSLAAEGKLTVWGAILAGTLGSLVGGLFNYFFALWVGRTFLLRYGRYFFVPADKLLWAEQHWSRHGELTTFVCRLLPAIRQLISLPAGLARMNLGRFCLWTTAGAGLWVTILTLVGYFFGPQASALWKEHQVPITVGLIGAAALMVVVYVIRHVLKSSHSAPEPSESREAAMSGKP